MIDIVMATYNGEKYLAEQIDSILNQSFQDTRILVRDDGSKDQTKEIIREYEMRYPERVKLIEDNVRCGSSKSNFMQALTYTEAEYVMFADQDDFWLKDKVLHSYEKMLELEQQHGKDKPILVFGSYQPADENLHPIRDNAKNRQEAAYKLRFSNLLVQNYVNGCLMMVNRTLANMMGSCDEAILMHDWWAALVASGGGAIAHIDEVMMLYRQHGNNVVGSVNVRSLQYIISKIKDPNTKNSNAQYLGQARLLQQRLNRQLTYENQAVLQDFLDLFHQNKLKRMVGLLKGRYTKGNLIRILGQLWYA